MGVLDKRQKRYFEDPKRFADTWNALVFQGLEVIRWEELSEGNPVLTYAGASQTLEKTSDIVMKRTSGGNLLAVLVLENQKRMDYSIPVRILLEEAIAYDKQVREIKRYNEALAKGLERHGDVGELLYLFKRKDRLKPISTLVLYWDDKPWDGAKSLKELIDFQGMEEMRDLVPEYRVHLVEMSKVKHTDFFRTDMKSMVEYFQRKNDWERFREYSENCEPRYELDEEGLQVMGELVNTEKFKFLREERERKLDTERDKAAGEIPENGKEKGTVCKAIDDLIEQGRNQGIRQGELLALKNIMESMQLTLEQAMNALKIPMEEREELEKTLRENE